MPEFTIHTIDSAPDEAKETLKAAEKQFGFLPNLLGELASAPPALKAYVTLNQLLQETSFSAGEQQLLLVAISRANACEYCVAAHSAGMKKAGVAQDQIEAVRDGRSLNDPKLEALRTFATTVVKKRGHLDDGDVQRFLDAGYEKNQILEVLLAVGMKTLSNYTNHIAKTPLDDPLEAFVWEPQVA